jgi:hypothetical protein
LIIDFSGGMMPLYKVPCFWQVGGYHEVQADTAEEAGDWCNAPDSLLPEQSSYVEGSFEVEYEQIIEVNMPDLEEMKAWVDNASFTELLTKWRFEPAGSPWFIGEMGDYFTAVMGQKQKDIPREVQVAASKAVGWEK